MNNPVSQPYLREVFFKVLVVFGLCLFSILAGLAAVTNSVLIIGPVVGLAFSVFLFIRPDLAIHFVFFSGLYVVGLLPLVMPGSDKLSWVLAIISFAVGGWGLLQSAGRKHGYFIPWYIYLLVAFLIHSLMASLINFSNPLQVVAGFKRLFQFWGLIPAALALGFSSVLVGKWRRIFFYGALIQLPICLFQLLYVVPRVPIARDIIPIDVIGGTFGSSFSGSGASGDMAMYQVIVWGFILALWKEKLWSLKKAALISALVLAPLFVGEVKVVVVYIPLMLFTLFWDDLIRNPGRFISILILTFLVVGCAGYIYFSFIAKSQFLEEVENIYGYNFGDRGYGRLALNRTTVLTFWWKEHGLHNILQMFMGHGLGSSNLASGGIVGGEVARQYPLLIGLGLGLTNAASMLWDVGLLGFSVFLLFLIVIWWDQGRLLKKTSDSWLRSQIAPMRGVTVILIVSLFYKSSFTSIAGFQVLFVAYVIYHIYLCTSVRDYLPVQGQKYAV
ncbi:hypothetical protein N8I74_15070 [Chitiniphilus purpureus]|uniref:O-antigen ligase family protein n=1 Tax=Chitiniphilus purpureus TaxID=2981137 RepID=A0ABY6DNE4_9NEIS|nr:hypothetical protein [Chitiniphilus sp. CD1]UXY14631.1 hypothetical protein N8I74_15070 [Chitiniphilus sp. CD1]